MEVSWKGTSKSSILIQLKPSSNRGYLHSYGNLHILTHDTNPADSLWWTSDLAQILRKTRGKDQMALWMSWFGVFVSHFHSVQIEKTQKTSVVPIIPLIFFVIYHSSSRSGTCHHPQVASRGGTSPRGHSPGLPSVRPADVPAPPAALPGHGWTGPVPAPREPQGSWSTALPARSEPLRRPWCTGGCYEQRELDFKRV